MTLQKLLKSNVLDLVNFQPGAFVGEENHPGQLRKDYHARPKGWQKPLLHWKESLTFKTYHDVTALFKDKNSYQRRKLWILLLYNIESMG